jgi:hypothetical protein
MRTVFVIVLSVIILASALADMRSKPAEIRLVAKKYRRRAQSAGS